MFIKFIGFYFKYFYDIGIHNNNYTKENSGIKNTTLFFDFSKI